MGEHWDLHIAKSWMLSKERVIVLWEPRQIFLTSRSIQNNVIALQDCTRYNSQYRVAHEFGHALGNVGLTPETCGDEYIRGHLFSNDIDSIMCIGNDVRGHHFHHQQLALQQMLPDTIFEIKTK